MGHRLYYGGKQVSTTQPMSNTANNTISLNTWEGNDASYNRFSDYGPTVRRAIYRRRSGRGTHGESVQGREMKMQGGEMNLGLTVEISPRHARRVLWGNRIAALAPYALCLLLTSAGLWLLRGYDEGHERAALKREQADTLRIRRAGHE